MQDKKRETRLRQMAKRLNPNLRLIPCSGGYLIMEKFGITGEVIIAGYPPQGERLRTLDDVEALLNDPFAIMKLIAKRERWRDRLGKSHVAAHKNLGDPKLDSFISECVAEAMPPWWVAAALRALREAYDEPKDA